MGYYAVAKIRDKKEYIVFKSDDDTFIKCTEQMIINAFRNGAVVNPFYYDKTKNKIRRHNVRSEIAEVDDNGWQLGEVSYTLVYKNDKGLLGFMTSDKELYWASEENILKYHDKLLLNNIRIIQSKVCKSNTDNYKGDTLNFINFRAICENKIPPAPLVEDKNIKLIYSQIKESENATKNYYNLDIDKIEFYKNVLIVMQEFDIITFSKEIFNKFYFEIIKNVDITLSMSKYVSLGTLKFNKNDLESIIVLVKFDESSEDCTVQILKRYRPNIVSNIDLEYILLDYKTNARYLRV